jgi:hypothetical protein
MENKKARAPKRPLPLDNLRPLADYFFLLADFLAAGFLALDLFCFDFADLLAIMLLVLWFLTSRRDVSFPAEESSMAAGTAAVNHAGEVICAGAAPPLPSGLSVGADIGADSSCYSAGRCDTVRVCWIACLFQGMVNLHVDFVLC